MALPRFTLIPRLPPDLPGLPPAIAMRRSWPRWPHLSCAARSPRPELTLEDLRTRSLPRPEALEKQEPRRPLQGARLDAYWIILRGEARCLRQRAPRGA